MTTVSEALAVAVRHHQAGRFDDARCIYHQILQIDGRNSQTLHLLGALSIQTGEPQIAIDLFRQAIAIEPHQPDYRNNLGLALFQVRRVNEAVAEYRQALKLRSDSPEAFNNLGNALKALDQTAEAIEAYQNAIALQNNFADAYNNLGVTYQATGQWIESIVSFQNALTIDSNYLQAHYNLGISLQKLGRLDDALDAFQNAIAIHSGYAEAFNGRGHVYMERSQHALAIESLQRAIELKPSYAPSYVNLGSIYQELNEPEEAIRYLDKAISFQPDSLLAWLGLVHQKQWACQWAGLEELSRQVIRAIERGRRSNIFDVAPPFWFLCLPVPTTAQEQLECARRWIDQPQFAVGQGPPSVHSSTDKLRIGYLSGDFRTHATAWLIAELFEAHNREQFEVYGYSFGPNDHSPMRRRLEAGFDQFRDITPLSHPDSSALITADQIDILIDLKGYTCNARTEILARRPAPVQVNFLGYPGTMGAKFIDYILVDDFVVPVDQQANYSERLVHLPDSYQVNDGQRREISETPTRQSCGLPEKAFVFCSFNASFKFTPQLFDSWGRLLKAIPSSVLWLLESNRDASKNLVREIEARGIAADRLVFAPKAPLQEHLARHRLADLFLDCFPVNAHTTASDALRMGLPIVTCAGSTFVSRVAGSLLRTVGLPELITYSLADYEALALRLAQDSAELNSIRQRLNLGIQSSSLFDGRRFAMYVEQAYKTMWEQYERGQRPQSIVIGRGA